MVRFKLYIELVFFYCYKKSQFHYGSIQTEKLRAEAEKNWYESLNSTMVRFKLIVSLTALTNKNLVSIPLWFDSNGDHSRERAGGMLESQFHYGSIQTNSRWSISDKTNCRLNSTMVRFKQLSSKVSLAMGNIVSIPLWFDSNWKR